MAFVIVFSTIKGGTGKTTLASHEADYHARHGQRVLLIDCDPSQWDSYCLAMGDRAADPESGVVVSAPCGVDVVWIRDIDDLPGDDVISRYDIVVIDGRPDETLSGLIARLANRVCAPWETAADLFHARRYQKRVHDLNPRAEFILVQNCVRGKCPEGGVPYRRALERSLEQCTLTSSRKVFDRSRFAREVLSHGPKGF